MRYTIRHLLIFAAGIAVAMAGYLAYQKAWELHRAELEPSLAKKVLRPHMDLYADFDEPSYFVYGDPQAISWGALPEGVSNQFMPEDLLSFAGNFDAPVFYISNVTWIDWQTVSLDYGVVGNFGSGHGYDDALLENTGSEWVFLSRGEEWITPEGLNIQEDGSQDRLQGERDGSSTKKE